MFNKKGIIKFYSILVALSAGTFIAMWIYNSPETLLFMRALNIIFFMYIIFKLKRFIDSFKVMIDAGVAEHLFNPKYLLLMLFMLISGITAGAIMDYFYLPTWWFLGYMAGSIIIPFSSGAIPLRKKDNIWRNK